METLIESLSVENLEYYVYQAVYEDCIRNPENIEVYESNIDSDDISGDLLESFFEQIGDIVNIFEAAGVISTRKGLDGTYYAKGDRNLGKELKGAWTKLKDKLGKSKFVKAVRKGVQKAKNFAKRKLSRRGMVAGTYVQANKKVQRAKKAKEALDKSDAKHTNSKRIMINKYMRDAMMAKANARDKSNKVRKRKVK